jgi:general secretion pathway protein D
MIRPIHLRAALSGRRPGSSVLGFALLASFVASISGQAQATQDQVVQSHADQGVAARGHIAAQDQVAASQAQQAAAEPAKYARVQPVNGSDVAKPVAGVGSHIVEPQASKRHLREAEDAYLAGAKKLQRDDLDAAEHEFLRALALDPGNRNYAIAISVTRQHRLTELVQQATKARRAGDQEKAKTLLSEARAIDPTSPMVIEHSEPVMVVSEPASQQGVSDVGKVAPVERTVSVISSPLADRSRMLSSAEAREPWKIQAPVLAGAIRLAPSDKVESFALRGASQDVIRDVASAFGIRAVLDDSVERKDLHFNIENVDYQQAMAALMSMAHVFAVSINETSIVIAKDDAGNRERLQRQLEETINLPGATTEQINELANVIRTIFEVKQATVQTTLGSIVVRAPEDIFAPMNRTIEGLMESSGEVMIEVKIYQVNTTRMLNVGATLPSQFTAFNVDQAATALVNANQTLVQQAIAQGFIKPTASNLEIALALIGSGLVQSNLATNLIGVFGGGALKTGISGAANTSLNLGLNSSDTRALDDVQIRVGDRQPAIFREGTRYPITSSTYSTGLSTAASTLSNASINGVSVAGLLSQFAGGTGATIPQVTYEDLGVTLNATPVIQKSGRINLLLSLKIEALAGGSANGIPVLASRQFASDITLLDGESALMVSNVSRSESAAMTGIPALSELPGFQMPTERNAEKDSSQLVVVVTPHVVRRRSDLVSGPRIAIGNQTVN